MVDLPLNLVWGPVTDMLIDGLIDGNQTSVCLAILMLSNGTIYQRQHWQ